MGGPKFRAFFFPSPAAKSPNVDISGPRLHKNHQNSTRRHTVSDKKERNWWRERAKKSEILGGPAEGGRRRGGPASGGLAQGGPGESKPTTTTTITTTTPTPPEMEGGAKPRRSVAQTVGNLLPGFGVRVCRVWFRSECRSLGLWGLGFLGLDNSVKTLKH